jgi:GNAT superfamily N-acetyltransferase
MALVRTATPSDAQAAFALINSAYHVETGDVPPAFKLTTRFLAAAELLPLLSGGRVLAATAPDGALLGVLAFSLHSDPATGALRAHFGPFAVHTSAQGGGVGRALLAELAVRARAEGCCTLDAEVVNHRHDLFPLYLGRLGFRVVGTAPFPAPERLTRPAHFVLIRKGL